MLYITYNTSIIIIICCILIYYIYIYTPTQGLSYSNGNKIWIRQIAVKSRMQWVGREVKIKCSGVFGDRGTSYDVCVGVEEGQGK